MGSQSILSLFPAHAGMTRPGTAALTRDAAVNPAQVGMTDLLPSPAAAEPSAPGLWR